MNLTDISIGLTIAFVVYGLVGHFLQRVPSARAPWEAAPVDLPREKRRGFFPGVGKRYPLNAWALRRPEYRQNLDLLLLRAGRPYEWSVEDFFFFKHAAAGLVVFALWALGVTDWYWFIVGAVVGFFYLDFYLKDKAKARQAEIARRLPGLVDLMTLTIEGGLDLIAALERILEKLKAGPLREELFQIIQESRLGTPRKEVLEHWSFRTNLPEVQALSNMIIQSEELGTSLSTVLRSYADDMRIRRITRAEEIAGKAPVKLLFPIVVFFFPVVFVIILGPMGMSLWTAK